MGSAYREQNRNERLVAASLRDAGLATRDWKQNRHRAGFTLMELILAVTITSVIAAALFASLRIAFDARERAEDRLAGRQAARTALTLLATDLQAVPEPTGMIAGPFIGLNARMGAAREADTVRYVTGAMSLPTDSGMGDLRVVELALATDPADPDTQMLVRYVTTNLLASTTPEPEPQVLARGVVAFNLRYFDGGDWLDEWDSGELENTLPEAVEITLTVRPERQRQPRTTDEAGGDLTMVRLVRLPAAPQPEASSSSGGGGGLFSF